VKENAVFSVLPRWRGFALGLLLVAGCGPKPAGPAPAGEKPKTESDLARTTLPVEDRKSLGIRTEPARIENVQETRERTGWVMPKQGDEVTLTAPVPGIVRQGKTMPIPGAAVEQDAELFALEPVLPPLDQVQLASLKRGIENDIAKARELQRAAQSEYDRLKDLYDQKLRSKQDLEQANVRLTNAREDLAAAQDRQKLFALRSGTGTGLPPQPIRSPRAGHILTVSVGPGQYVTAGTPLVSVADLSRLWLRVPVNEQDLERVNHTAKADVFLRVSRSKRMEAKPLGIVPAVNPDTHTADALYELPAMKGVDLFKEQMLTVLVPLRKASEETVVPYSAIVFDAYAGAWVYIDLTKEDAKHDTYERRRVQLGASLGKDLVIRPGLKKGERVVVDGAAALFSREFHKPPGVPSGQDLDDDD
jgi:RND family efflux transporter MFP subunit